jgi:hypothetical protein
VRPFFNSEDLESYLPNHLPDSKYFDSLRWVRCVWPWCRDGIISARKWLETSPALSNYRQNPLDEQVYNSPNIDTPKVVWAREMDPAHNLELMYQYAGCKV